ncbi:hypothetical protein DV738_g688, partial [Chaetothyriales sp. CBS 135597]
MVLQTVFFGRFVDTPKLDELRIRTGALLVSSQDGRGVISQADWTITSASEAASKFGVEENVVISSKENGAKAVYSRVVSATLAHGTTTASYYATISVPATNILSQLAFTRGQRAYIGRVCMDNPATCEAYYRDSSTEESLQHEHAHIAFCSSLDPSGELLAPIITPRFAPSCLPSTLTALGQLARDKDLRIQTHISENADEIRLVQQLFPEQESYAEVYDTHQLLTPRTILAHAIHLQPAEIQTIKVRGSKIAHCPASNSALILDAVRQACLVSRHVGYIHGGGDAGRRHNLSVGDALYLATVGGAKVVGMAGKLGLFEEGMLYDAQEIDLGDDIISSSSSSEGGEQLAGDSPVDIFGWESWENKVAKWVWNGDDRNVKRVWVGGRLVHERAKA